MTDRAMTELARAARLQEWAAHWTAGASAAVADGRLGLAVSFQRLAEIESRTARYFMARALRRAVDDE